MASVQLQQKPKAKQDKQSHAQAVAKQVLTEPFEILKTAGDQVTGREASSTEDNQWEKQTTVSKPQTGEQPAFGNQQDVVQKQKREARHYQAFQNELAEIRRLQKQRDQERQQLRIQEHQKKAQEEQKQKEQQPLVEPITRKARGVLGGVGAMLGVKRKQRSTELAKAPSN